MNELNQYCNKDLIIRILGNKSDIDISKYQILDEEINHFCSELNIEYKDVSAKNNTNIEEVFTDILIELKV